MSARGMRKERSYRKVGAVTAFPAVDEEVICGFKTAVAVSAT